MWRAAIAIAWLGCGSAPAPSTTAVTNTVVPGRRAEIRITDRGVGTLTPDTAATLPGLRHALAGFDVRERRIGDDEDDVVFDVFDHGELLYYVIPNNDHGIFELHISSDRIVDDATGWRIGGISVDTPVADHPSPSHITGCVCGELTEPIDRAFAYIEHQRILISVGNCSEDPPRIGEPHGGDGYADSHYHCPVAGKITRMIWRVPERD